MALTSIAPQTAPPAAPAPVRSRRRQWGAERSTAPLPIVHTVPTDRALALGRLAIIATILAWGAYVVWTVLRQFLDHGAQSFRFTMEATSYVVVVSFLTFSALMYLTARQGAMLRFRVHRRTSRSALAQHFEAHHPALTVLVPSYAEEPGVVRQTLWSAALQEYPEVRVVLLLDDPPRPGDPVAEARLEATRALAAEIEQALAAPRTRYADALLVFEMTLAEGTGPSQEAVRTLAGHYADAAGWLRATAAAEARVDHVDAFFAEQVLGALAEDLAVTGEALGLAVAHGERPGTARMRQLHQRLAWTFRAEVRTFERKRYASLSHEANKAMNLNSYLGLMGHAYEVHETFDGVRLIEVDDDPSGADLVVPDSPYVLTLDADSLLLREYCLRLVHLLEQPGNERVAVTQTPYSSYRGAGTRIERLAAATTDLQHLLHQGMTRSDATFWVGANAVIRKAALADIAETEVVDGFPVTRYVQDRTVIEDTESSIDLSAHGWTLVNYPERLSYSATPPDFGALVVQRRRWADGGLLILPKLVRQVREQRRRREPVNAVGLMLRVNYLASITWSSFGLLFLLGYPYDSRLLSPFVLAAALPYFLCMGADLRACGYRFTDIFRIYGFNLILLPVNLAGVLKSLQQALTGRKIPFARTPKVRNRTAVPLTYVAVPLLIVAFSVFTCWRDYHAGNWGNAAFACFNAWWGLWAVVAYIGVGATLVDLLRGVLGWFYVDASRGRFQRAAVAPAATLDWRAVLEQGEPGALRSRQLVVEASVGTPR
jgi:cellulose synthase/poly-beta-1,6-N-acetylglucosamine synthase-like glycosyltransferase